MHYRIGNVILFDIQNSETESFTLTPSHSFCYPNRHFFYMKSKPCGCAEACMNSPSLAMMTKMLTKIVFNRNVVCW